MPLARSVRLLLLLVVTALATFALAGPATAVVCAASMSDPCDGGGGGGGGTPPPASITLPSGSHTTTGSLPAHVNAYAGASVTLMLDGVTYATDTAPASGTSSFTVTMSPGDHTLTAQASTAATGPGPVSSPVSVNYTPAPGAPVLTAPADGSLTNATSVGVTGTGPANTSIDVYVDDALYATATSNLSGNYGLFISSLGEGVHRVYTQARNLFGDVGAPSATRQFTVDTTAPAIPVILSPVSGSTLPATNITIAGTAEANSTVTVQIDGSNAPTTADASGNWTLTRTLSQGSHTVVARATDAAGNFSLYGSTKIFTVDTVAPATPTITSPAAGSLGNSSVIAVTGTAEPNSTVSVLIDATSVQTHAAANGSFSFAHFLADGSHTVRARATDAAGNAGVYSTTTSFTVDTAAPAAPTILSPANGTALNSATATFTGQAEADSTVTVLIDGSTSKQATADATGRFTLLHGGLAEGSHTVRARATDAAGNTGAYSATTSFTVDTTAPAKPAITAPAAGAQIGDNTPTITGTSEPQASVQISVSGIAADSAVADASGQFTWTAPSALDDGAHTVSAQATDPAGNTGQASDPTTFTVDTVAPDAPLLTAPAGGALLNDATPQVSGRAQAGARIRVYLDGQMLGATDADGAGDFQFTPADPVGDGDHTVKVSATDAAGNTSAFSAIATITVDTVAPDAPQITAPADGDRIGNPVLRIAGHTQAGAHVRLLLDGQALGETDADVNGDFQFTPSDVIADGDHTVKASATDAAHNTSSLSAAVAFTVDTVAPDAPQITAPADGAKLRTATPTFTGTAEPGTDIAVSVDGAPVGNTRTDHAGDFSVTSSALSEDAHQVDATATDGAGNRSVRSAARSFTVDVTDPVAPHAPAVPAATAGVVASDTPQVNISGAETGSTVHVLIDGDDAASGAADADGNASVTLSHLDDGSYTLTARSVDDTGNTGPQSPPTTLTVDTTAPDAPQITAPADGARLADGTPDITVAGVQGDTITVLDGSAEIGHATITDAAVTVTITAGALSDASHTLSAVATDPVGNRSTSSAPVTVTVDTSAPDTPTFTRQPASFSSASSFAFTGENGARFDCQVDQGAWEPCSSPSDLTGLDDGPHRLAVRATDPTGNDSPAAVATWTLDRRAPGAPAITSAPAAASTSTLARLEFSGEPDGSFTCQLDEHAATLCASPATYTGLAVGAHTFTVRQIDAAGNTGAKSTVTWAVQDTPGETTDPTPHATTVVPAVSTARGAGIAVGCQVSSGALTRCRVRAYIHGDLVGQGTRTFDGQGTRGTVTVKLTAAGREAVGRLGGAKVTFKIAAVDAAGRALTASGNSRVEPESALSVPADGLFSTASQKLNGAGRRYVRQAAAGLAHSASVRCIGHTDSRGSTASNQALGLRRARRMCAALKHAGVTAKLTVRSAGERQPRATNMTAKGRVLNRRVELAVSYR